MQRIPITEKDLISENEYRFADAINLCRSGDPQGCIINGRCAHESECFDCVSIFDGKTKEQLIDMIEERDKAISHILKMHKSLLAAVSRNIVSVTTRYLSAVKQNDKSVFMICSIEQMFKRTYTDSERKLNNFFEEGAKAKND